MSQELETNRRIVQLLAVKVIVSASAAIAALVGSGMFFWLAITASKGTSLLDLAKHPVTLGALSVLIAAHVVVPLLDRQLLALGVPPERLNKKKPH